MSLRLYLEDCAYSKQLRAILRGPPHHHDVVTPVDVHLLGLADPIHFDFARRHDRVLVTKNPADFEALHAVEPDHPGIFAIYQDNLPSDMTPRKLREQSRTSSAPAYLSSACSMY